MIDCLLAQLPKTESRDTVRRFGVEAGDYATLTLHRPSNVDDPEVFDGIVDTMLALSQELPIIWPVHPRSRKTLEQLGLTRRVAESRGLRLTDPLGYLDMLTLNRRARLILTDSGGLPGEGKVTRVVVVCRLW